MMCVVTIHLWTAGLKDAWGCGGGGVIGGDDGIVAKVTS